MESLSLYEIHKVCRICLKNDILVSIYSPTFPIRPIEMLRKLQIFKLPIDDNLSTLLCQSCLYRLLDAYNLQQLAESSEQRLKEYLGLTVKLNNTSIATELPDLSEADKGDTVSANIYDNIYDIFDRNEVTSNDIVEVVGNDDVDLLNDVEIDVSSLTRSEVDDNTLSDMFMQRNDRLIKYPMESPYLKDTHKIGDIPKHLESKEVLDNEYKSDAHALGQCLECDKLYHYAECSNSYACMQPRENAFKCKICSVQLSKAGTLQMPERHTLLNDAPLGRRYQCEICAAFFTTSSNLKAHKFTHCEQRNFQCKQCQRSFKSQRDLRRHEPMHKLIKDLICTVCVKAFTKNKYLRAHMLTVHRGVKRHKCSECDKMFGKRSNLICHLRTHTGEKPYHCTICSWKFNQSSALMRHLKKHTNRSVESTEATKTTMIQKSNATASTESPLIDFSQQG